MSEGWLQVAHELLKIPGLLLEIYGDLARPGVRQVGKALDTIIGLGNTILWPIAWANERSRATLERNLEKYRQSLERIPEEKIVGVAPEIGVPIAEKLSYVRDDKLSDLYVHLLTKASNADTLDQAHPSFVNVINNLSPEEAMLLECFLATNDLEFISAKAVVPETGVYFMIREIIIPVHISAGLRFPTNIEAYFNNLAGLGLLVVRRDAWIDGSPVYRELVEGQSAEEMTRALVQNEQIKGRQLKFDKGVIAITLLGRQFIQACHVK